MARTAAVVGTATATRNAVGPPAGGKEREAVAQAEQQVYAQQAPPPPPPPADNMDDKLAQLYERLGQLKAQGILSEEEFAAQKAAILG